MICPTTDALPSLHAPQDIEGTPIASLAAYRVSVSIAEVTLEGVPARQVQVTVRDPRGETLSLLRMAHLLWRGGLPMIEYLNTSVCAASPWSSW